MSAEEIGVGIILIGAVIFGFCMIGWGTHSSRTLEDNTNAAARQFVHTRYGLAPSEVHCDMQSGPDSYEWCSFPLNGRMAWAICTRTDGCFTRY